MDKVDMSLDDIIKMNKKQMRQNKKNKTAATGKGPATKKPYITKQTLQKKLQNQQQGMKRGGGAQGTKKLNIKPKPQRNRPLTAQNSNRQPGSPGQAWKKLNQKRGNKLSLQQQKAQKVQQNVDRRRKLQQNRMRVNRPGSVTSNQSKISDAKLLKIAKALLLKKSGANMLTTPQAATNTSFSARRLRQEQNRVARANQGSPRKRRDWNRMANADPSKPESILTVHVQNNLANSNSPRRKRLNRPNVNKYQDTSNELLVQTVSNPVASPQFRQRAAGAPPISTIVKSMKPKVEMTYDFSKDVFAQGKTTVGLSQRFSSGSGQQSRSAAAAPPGTRQVYW